MAKKMVRSAYSAYRWLLNAMAWPYDVRSFFSKHMGKECGVGFMKKMRMVFLFMRNVRKIETASHWLGHLEMARQILNVPKWLEGDVIECGCYKKGGIANLSIVCSLVRRRLIVCDSFQGLPEPEDGDRVHCLPDGRTNSYRRGMYECSLEIVRANMKRWGEMHTCEFVPGMFEDTLPIVEGPFVAAFVGIDLRKSLETCVLHLT